MALFLVLVQGFVEALISRVKNLSLNVSTVSFAGVIKSMA
jgi:hypothetical protein